jgi:hypothetical protein
MEIRKIYVYSLILNHIDVQKNNFQNLAGLACETDTPLTPLKRGINP